MNENTTESAALKFDISTPLQLMSLLSLIVGLLIAFYFFLLPVLQEVWATTSSAPSVSVSWTPIDKMDRLIGIVFGFGLAFLGAFGLYAERRKSDEVGKK